jgi:hypothetical protein
VPSGIINFFNQWNAQEKNLLEWKLRRTPPSKNAWYSPIKSKQTACFTPNREDKGMNLRPFSYKKTNSRYSNKINLCDNLFSIFSLIKTKRINLRLWENKKATKRQKKKVKTHDLSLLQTTNSIKIPKTKSHSKKLHLNKVFHYFVLFTTKKFIR